MAGEGDVEQNTIKHTHRKITNILAETITHAFPHY